MFYNLAGAAHVIDTYRNTSSSNYIDQISDYILEHIKEIETEVGAMFLTGFDLNTDDPTAEIMCENITVILIWLKKHARQKQLRLKNI